MDRRTPVRMHFSEGACVLNTCRGGRASIACVLLLCGMHSVATLLHACTGCLAVTIQARILSKLRLPMPGLSLSSVQTQPFPIGQATAKYLKTGVPSAHAPYSKEPDKRHGFPFTTSRICPCMLVDILSGGLLRFQGGRRSKYFRGL